MSHLLHVLHQFVNKVCDQKLANSKFPGTLPVSLCRETIPLLYGLTQANFAEYILSYKADGYDGGRYFLLFLEVEEKGYAVLLNRKMEATYLSTSVYRSALAGTLLDVEKLRLADGTILLLIFDTLAVNGNIVTKYHYLQRLELARLFLQTLAQSDASLQSQVFAPTHPGVYPSRYADIRITAGQLHNVPLSLQVKQVYYVQALATLSPSTHYPTDGFIWTLGASRYTPFRSSLHNVIKWKPLEKITLDFQIQKTTRSVDISVLGAIPTQFIGATGDFGLFAANQDRLVLVSRVQLVDMRAGVYECAWIQGAWQIVQHRPDKAVPNHLETVERTIHNITEAIPLTDIY